MVSVSAATVKLISSAGSAASRLMVIPSMMSLNSFVVRSTVKPSMIAWALKPTVMLLVLCATPSPSGPVPSMVRPAMVLVMPVIRLSSPVSSEARTSW